MNKNIVAIAEAYYDAMSKRNLEEMKKYLHPEVHFLSPFKNLVGSAAFLAAIRDFTSAFSSLTVRAKFGSGNQAMVAYDVEFPIPVGTLRTAALLTFQDDLITNIELFFDTRSFT